MGAIGIGSPASRQLAIYGAAKQRASNTSPPATWTSATSNAAWPS